MYQTLIHIRSWLLEILTHKLGLPLLFFFKKNKPFSFTLEELSKFNDDTLGYILAETLVKNNYKLLKNYEQHDCKHIILDYPMNELGEARMQFYFLGNRHYSFAVIATVLVCFIIMPEHWKLFRKDIVRGRKSGKLSGINFSELVLQNIDSIKQKLNIQSHEKAH